MKLMADEMRINRKQDTNFLNLWRDKVLNVGPSKWKNQSAVPETNKFDVYVNPSSLRLSQFKPR